MVFGVAMEFGDDIRDEIKRARAEGERAGRAAAFREAAEIAARFDIGAHDAIRARAEAER